MQERQQPQAESRSQRLPRGAPVFPPLLECLTALQLCSIHPQCAAGSGGWETEKHREAVSNERPRNQARSASAIAAGKIRRHRWALEPSGWAPPAPSHIYLYLYLLRAGPTQGTSGQDDDADVALAR